MKIAENIHKIHIPFRVTETIERFVYIYLLQGEKLHMIDAGVDGGHKAIDQCAKNLGHSLADVATLLLTHTHPDHIGGAFALNQFSNCTVMGPEAERAWVENVNSQFADRPVPNFFHLAKHSIVLKTMLKGGETLTLEPGMTIEVLDSKGHSPGSLSYLWVEKKTVFCGDAITRPGEPPMFDSARDSLASLATLKEIDAHTYLTAWDEPYDRTTAHKHIDADIACITALLDSVKKHRSGLLGKKGDALCKAVASDIGIQSAMAHPLFKRSVEAAERELFPKKEKAENAKEESNTEAFLASMKLKIE